jgi:hypothetical protein
MRYIITLLVTLVVVAIASASLSLMSHGNSDTPVLLIGFAGSLASLRGVLNLMRQRNEILLGQSRQEGLRRQQLLWSGCLKATLGVATLWCAWNGHNVIGAALALFCVSYLLGELFAEQRNASLNLLFQVINGHIQAVLFFPLISAAAWYYFFGSIPGFVVNWAQTFGESRLMLNVEYGAGAALILYAGFVYFKGAHAIKDDRARRPDTQAPITERQAA